MSSESLLDMNWQPPPGVRAAFTTRQGGVSEAPWSSFNVATHVGDNPAAVMANRAQLKRILTLPSEPTWLSQVHGTEVANADAMPAESAPVADASVATQPGRVCAVMVADCLPVLFAARDGSKVAAAHAGWRGLATGVLERTVAALGLPASELVVWLGPAISPAHFEVGDDVRTAFVDIDPGSSTFFVANARRKWQADLSALARRRLERLGIGGTRCATSCTFSDSDRFYSYRRDGNGGRMAALIWRAQMA